MPIPLKAELKEKLEKIEKIDIIKK